MPAPTQVKWNHLQTVTVDVMSVPVPDWNRMRARIEKAKSPHPWQLGTGSFLLGIGLPVLWDAITLDDAVMDPRRTATWVVGIALSLIGMAGIGFHVVLKQSERDWLEVVLDDMDDVAALYPPTSGIASTTQSVATAPAQPASSSNS